MDNLSANAVSGDHLHEPCKKGKIISQVSSWLRALHQAPQSALGAEAFENKAAENHSSSVAIKLTKINFRFLNPALLYAVDARNKSLC